MRRSCSSLLFALALGACDDDADRVAERLRNEGLESIELSRQASDRYAFVARRQGMVCEGEVTVRKAKAGYRARFQYEPKYHCKP